MLRRRSTELLVAIAIAIAASACAAGAPTAAQRATMLVQKGQEREAMQVLRQHLAEHPDALPERKLLIRIAALLGDLGTAAREAELLGARLGPGDPTPWIEMGHAYELTHRYEEALAMYDRAAEVAPKSPAGPREGGLRAARWGEVELAAPRLEEALRRDVRDAELWHALGVVRLELHDFPAARRAYESGLKADPSAIENRLGLATLAVAEGDAASALAHYDAIVKARPGLADARLGRTWALLKLGRLDEAEAGLRDAERLGANASAIAKQRDLLRRLQSEKIR